VDSVSFLDPSVRFTQYLFYNYFTMHICFVVFSSNNRAKSFIPYSWGLKTSSAKSQMVHILGFEGYLVSVSTTQFCCYNSKAATDNMQTNGCGCVPIKLYFWMQI
jgi:hypothetical protein